MSDRKAQVNSEKALDPALERRLESWLESKASAVSPETQEKVEGMLKASLTPVKPLPSRRRLVLAFLGFFILCAAAIVPLTGWVGIRLMTHTQILWMVAVCAGGALLFSSTLASRMIPGSVTRLPLGLVLALLGAVLVGGIVLVFPWHLSKEFASEGWPCAALELAIAIPAAALFWWLVRRGSPFWGPGLGAGVAGLSVFLALTVVQSQCMFPQAPHVLVWHAGTAALIIGLGALAGLAGRRFRNPKYKPS